MHLNSVVLCLAMSFAFSQGNMVFPFLVQTEDPQERFVEANNAFAIQLYRHLAYQGGNIFLCPACLMSSMTMLMEGAYSKTEAELNRTLGYKNNWLRREMVRSSFAELNQRIKKMDCLAHIANALMVQKDPWGIPTDFQAVFPDLYNTVIRKVDFSENPQQAVWDINELVKQKTGGHIKDIFQRVDSSNQMLLLNAVHFRTKFVDVFDSNLSLKKRFYNHGVEDHYLHVFMMERKGAVQKVANSYDFRALELPCGETNGTEVKMWIFLPHKMGTLTDVEDGLSTATFQQVRDSFMDLEIDVSLPRIRFEFTKDISKELQRLGLHQTFEPDEADFRGISGKEHLALTQVLQNSLIEINESRKMNTTSNPTPGKISPHSDVPPFLVNHPFLFCVVDKVTGIILYIGRVLKF